jgi:hypothetical protein
MRHGRSAASKDGAFVNVGWMLLTAVLLVASPK